MIESFDYDFTENILNNKNTLEIITDIAEKIDRYHIKSVDTLVKLDEIISTLDTKDSIYEVLNNDDIDINFKIPETHSYIKQLEISTDNIAYIAINELLNNNTFEFALKLIQDTKGLILDLSSTRGVNTYGALEVLNMLLDNNTSINLTVKNQLYENANVVINNNKYNKPIVVILDKNSESCANYIAYTLQGANKAIIIGEPTNNTNLKLEFIIEQYVMQITNSIIPQVIPNIESHIGQIKLAYNILNES